MFFEILPSEGRKTSVNLLFLLIVSGLKSCMAYWFYSESNITSKTLGVIDSFQVSEQDCGKFSNFFL